jgi:hypothetical protein
MRLSLKKAAYAVLSDAAQQEIRVRQGRCEETSPEDFVSPGSKSVPNLTRPLCEIWETQTLIWMVEESDMAKAAKWRAVESHISQETREIPVFPVRGFVRNRVCGFHCGKPHEARATHQAQQEIRGYGVPKIRGRDSVSLLRHLLVPKRFLGIDR